MNINDYITQLDSDPTPMNDIRKAICEQLRDVYGAQYLESEDIAYIESISFFGNIKTIHDYVLDVSNEFGFWNI